MEYINNANIIFRLIANNAIGLLNSELKNVVERRREVL